MQYMVKVRFATVNISITLPFQSFLSEVFTSRHFSNHGGLVMDILSLRYYDLIVTRKTY